MNYTKFFSKMSLLRQPSPIRSLAPLLKLPGMISLAGGLPNPLSFPFESCTFNLKDGSQISLDKAAMSIALQYSPSEGIADLYEVLKSHQIEKHSLVDRQDWNIIITSGSQDALTKAFEMLLDPGEDAVLVENPTYTGALAALHPLQPEMIEVPIDANGIIPEELERVITEYKGAKKIKFLYTIPTGQNPSGASLTVDRKKKILEIAEKFDFLVLEDDPYFYLNLVEKENINDKTDSDVTMLSMDGSGRVLRFDSLSKVLSSGIRIGWCTGPSPLIQRIHLHQQANSLHTSGLSQGVTAALLNEWGQDGLTQHVAKVQELYRKQRDMFVKSVEKHLKGYVEYSVPTAGMFLWMKLIGVEDSKSFIEEKAREKKVLMVPGQAFQPNDKPGPYVRASFSVEGQENMDLACERLAELLKENRKN
ncbi:2-aminoadipate aminotransferase [Acrasis kona]|uniref:2-aminoadipate aminotransferase n=1 Tax=Acrasis kona TaxID=1008807 RepID=A0AAW2Z0A4_9EUKA